MRYSRQHKAIQNIMHKHCTILTDDPKINTFIADHPSIIYKRATSIKDLLVSSEYKSVQQRNQHCPIFGTFKCGQCSVCSLMRKDKTFCLPNGEMFKPTPFVNCHTRGVVYYMECKCGAYYVGKTKQEFWKRVSQHKYSMDISQNLCPYREACCPCP